MNMLPKSNFDTFLERSYDVNNLYEIHLWSNIRTFFANKVKTFI